MTFSKIAFVVAAVGADSVSGQKPGDACTIGPADACTVLDDPKKATGMSCVADQEVDKKTGKPSKEGTCKCPFGADGKTREPFNTDDKRCEQKGEVKENKCGKVTTKIGDKDEHMCNWSKGKCELAISWKFACQKWTPSTKGATCSDNGKTGTNQNCIVWYPQDVVCTPNSEIQDWEALCHAINTDSQQESPIVMV